MSQFLLFAGSDIGGGVSPSGGTLRSSVQAKSAAVPTTTAAAAAVPTTAAAGFHYENHLFRAGRVTLIHKKIMLITTTIITIFFTIIITIMIIFLTSFAGGHKLKPP